ncbi:hypothetical protein AVS7_04389 [Acidovorax sp. MR-S7]|nr:hypothetical protein AVS7_04389 [Acidovorax sp. MR-S7]
MAHGGVVVHAHALAHLVGECLGGHQAIARQAQWNILCTEVAVLDALLHEGGDLGFQRFAANRPLVSSAVREKAALLVDVKRLAWIE